MNQVLKISNQIFLHLSNFGEPQQGPKLAGRFPKVKEVVAAEIIVEMKCAELLENLEVLANERIFVLYNVPATKRVDYCQERGRGGFYHRARGPS